jgi:hypothetical protein
MRRHRTIALSAALAVATSAAAHGQEPLPSVGDRVRYRLLAGDSRRTGFVTEIGEGWLTIAPGPERGAVRVNLSSLARLEVHRGRHRRAKEGALIGFVPGAVLGGLVGGYAKCEEQPFCNPAGGIVLGALVLGGFSAGAGALVGLAFKSDRWEGLPLGKARVSMAPEPGGIRATIRLGS